MRGFEDLHRIPVVNKAVLQQYGIEERSSRVKGRALVNTGGSSGQPLGFYIQGSAVAHEWAHMHRAWV